MIDQLTDEERNMAFNFMQFLLWRRDREELKALHETVGEMDGFPRDENPEGP